MLRNRRTVIFTLVMPAVFFLLFGTDQATRTDRRRQRQRHRLHPGQHGGVRRDAGDHQRRRHGVDRARGRLEPPAAADAAATRSAYIAVKVHRRHGARAGSVLVVVRRGRRSPAREMPAPRGSLRGVLAWVCSLVFAAFGLFMGYLLPSENVMQILGPVLALLSFAGGLFMPLDQMGHTFADHREVHPDVRRRRDRPLPADPRRDPGLAVRQRARLDWRSSRPARRGGSAATPPASERPVPRALG